MPLGLFQGENKESLMDEIERVCPFKREIRDGADGNANVVWKVLRKESRLDIDPMNRNIGICLCEIEQPCSCMNQI